MTRHKRSSNPAASSPPPFQFQQPQGRIDWTALDRLDLHRLLKEADLDTLEQLLPSIAYGNLRKYNLTEISPQSLRRLFEVSQLAVQYLLYVQDRLAADVKAVKGQLADAQAEVGALQASIAEARKDTDAAEREAKHARRMLRIALAQSQMSASSNPESQVPTPLSVEQNIPVQISAPVPAAAAVAAPPPAIPIAATVPTPAETPPVDPEAAERLKRLEDGIKELLQWKQVASAPLQPLATHPPCRSGSEAVEAVDISPKVTARSTASQNPEKSSYQAFQNILNDMVSQTPLQRQPSNNLAAAAAAAVNSSSTSCSNTALPPLTNLHIRTASNTPPRSPNAPRSPQKHQGNPQTPLSPSSPAIKRQFLRELPHEAVRHERPGVISRFPHPLSGLRAVRQELQAELESELVSELAAQGIHDPEGCRGLTPAQYLSCMEALQQRRVAAANQMNEQDKAREQYMRKTVTWHVDSVTKSVAAATKTTPKTTQSPLPLPLPPQTGPTLRPTTLRVGTTVTPPPAAAQTPTASVPSSTKDTSMEPSPVDLAMLEVRDQETDAFYSPLRRGHSATHEGHMMLPSGSGTPLPGSPSRQQQQPTTVLDLI